MSDHTKNPSFRYSNDNRTTVESVFIAYPSQHTISPLSTKGQRSYYPNDNGGYYSNSNRSSIELVDPTNNIQYPNENKLAALTLVSEASAGTTALDVGDADISHLNIGDTLVLSKGTEIEEEVIISSFNSVIIIEDPLQFTHSAGTVVDKKIIDTLDNEWLTQSGDKIITQSGDSLVFNLDTEQIIAHAWTTSNQSIEVQENQTAVNYDVDLEENDATSIEFILGGADANEFNIDSSTGAISFKIAPDYEVSELSYNINVIARETVLTIPDAIKQLTINITNVIDAPHYWETASEELYVEDNIQDDPPLLVPYTNDLVIGDAQILYEVDNPAFTINESGELSFVNAPDYDIQNNYTVSITAKDQNNNFEDQVKTINIIVYSLEMEWIIPEGSENISGTGDYIVEELEYLEGETIAVDHLTQINSRSADSISYSIAQSSPDGDSFLIDSQSGDLTFKNPPVYAELQFYSVFIEVTGTYSIPGEASLIPALLKGIHIYIKERIQASTQNTEEQILSSTPTNPSGAVTINFATDTNNLYIYDDEDWYIYDDIFITDATSTEAEILASSPTNPTDLVTVKHATDTNDIYVYYDNAWHIYFND